VRGLLRKANPSDAWDVLMKEANAHKPLGRIARDLRCGNPST